MAYIRDRVRVLGGRLAFGSSKEGASVRARLPLEPKKDTMRRARVG
jgi:signal transduction histidine kinase